MKFKPINKAVYRLSVVNCTMLAKSQEEKCNYCGRYGCTDRGYTIFNAESEMTLNEAALTQQIIDKLDETIQRNWMNEYVSTFRCVEPQCVRKLKKSNAETVVEKIKACDDACCRDDNPCPYRDEKSVCKRNVKPDGKPLVCMTDDDYYSDCPYHEHSFSQCYRRRNGNCTDLLEKYNASGHKDMLVLLAHRFSAAPCAYGDSGTCTCQESAHNEGICVLNGLMATCEHYKPVDSNIDDTEGVFTVVGSKDGKNDRTVFPSSDYARTLPPNERNTLCVACRISHLIAKLTGLKCLGVRRATNNPFLNHNNPLADYAIQINYLFLTNPNDVAKYNPELIAEAVFNGLILSCEGIQCEEYQYCKFNPL